MKTITLREPYASLMAVGAKHIETRSWGTDYRGPIAIHAAKGFSGDDWESCQDEAIEEALTHFEVPIYPNGGYCGPLKEAFWQTRGKVIATGRLVHCARFTEASIAKIADRYGDDELAFGWFTVGRFGWLIEDVQTLDAPVAVRGELGLWEWSGLDQAA